MRSMKAVLAMALSAGIGLARALGAGDRAPIEPVHSLSHGGPFGGTILSLAADPNDPAVLYAGTDVGLFRSADGGGSWTLTPVGRDFLSPASGFFADRVEGVTVSTADPSVVFASVLAHNRAEYPPHGFIRSLFRTADSGRTWQVTLTSGNPFSVAASGESIYVNTNFVDGAAMRSVDNGSTFARLPLRNAESVAADPLAPATVYAAMPTAIYPLADVEKSVDAGDHWQPTPLAGANVSRLHLDPSRHLTVYAEGNAFHRSDDGGEHWTGNLWTIADPIAAFTVGAEGRLYAAISAGDVYESEDRGETWSRVSAVPGGVLSLAASADALFAGTDGKGVFRSVDRGASWSPRSAGLDAAPVNAIVAAPSASGTAYALAAGFARTTDFGRTWSVDSFAPTAFSPGVPSLAYGQSFGAIAVDPADARIVYASDAVAGVLRSADGGATWAPASVTPRFVTSIAVSPRDPATLLMADGQLWKSTDRGASWRLVTAGIPDGAYLVASDPAISGLIYAATPDLYRSDDDGETWGLAAPAASLGRTIVQVVPDVAHAGTVYVLSSPGLSKSVDRGATWSPVEVPFPNSPTAVAVDAGGVVSVGTYSLGPEALPLPIPSDSFRSVDGGATWHSIASTNVETGPVGFVASMAAGPDGRLYLGMAANGVWISAGRPPRSPPPR